MIMNDTETREERFLSNADEMRWHGGTDAAALCFTLSLPAPESLSHAEQSSVPNGATSFCVGALGWLQAQNHRLHLPFNK